MLKILVSLPALNEEKTIGDILDKILNLKIEGTVFKVVVIDDGSTDSTSRIAREKGAKVVSHGSNQGVGVAFQSGVKEAINQGADILVNIDSDGQFDPKYISELVNPIISGESDFVTASRFISDSQIEMPKVKRWGNRQVARLVSRLTGQKVFDASCGFRAYSKKAFLNLSLIGDFTYTHETILTLAFRGIAIKEVSVPVRGTREFGQSRVASNLFKYAFHSMLIMIRAFRDYNPILTFGIPGAILFIVGVALLSLFFVWSMIRGEWFPKSAAFASAFFILSAMVFFLIALIADMFTRLRVHMENIITLIHNKDDFGGNH